MASRIATSIIPLNYYERSHAQLSDSVIGHVLPRGRATDRCVNREVVLQTPLETGLRATPATVAGMTPQHTTRASGRMPSAWKTAQTSALRGPIGASGDATGGLSPGAPLVGEPFSLRGSNQTSTCFTSQARETMSVPTTNFRASHKRFNDDTEQANTIEIKKAIRREQCRTNQARYRTRQRIHQRKLQLSVQQLHEELQALKLKRQRLHFKEKISRSAWSIVSEVFGLLETSFHSPWRMANTEEMMKHDHIRHSVTTLQKSFTQDVAMGELSGMSALMEQVRRYSLYFGDPQLHLQRVEEAVLGVLTATALLIVMVSEFTLRCVFPHLEKSKSEDEEEDDYQSLHEKLLDRRFDCSCKMAFLVDEESSRVNRLETSVDWVGPLLRLLGDTSDVSSVLAQALLTQGCAVGALVDYE